MQLHIREVNTVEGRKYELVEHVEDVDVIEQYDIGELEEAFADARFYTTGKF